MQYNHLRCLLFVLLPVALSAQLTVESDSALVEILSVYPDSFPLVDLQVRVQNAEGEPLWQLNPHELIVVEGRDTLVPHEVRPLTTPPSFDFCLVLDRSGSMIMNRNTTIYDLAYKSQSELLRQSPWGKAVRAIRSFQSTLEVDTLHRWSALAFDSEVIVAAELSRESNVYQALRFHTPRFGTAFYDALESALEELEDTSRTRYLIALTDGIDNESISNLDGVARQIKSSGVNLIVIGLGDVDSGALSQLARLSGGYYVYSSSAAKLESIYTELADRIKSIHSVSYQSKNMSSADTARQVIIQYNSAGIYSKAERVGFEVPDHMIDQMAEVEARVEFERKRNLILIIGGGILFVVGGAFAVRKLTV